MLVFVFCFLAFFFSCISTDEIYNGMTFLSSATTLGWDAGFPAALDTHALLVASDLHWIDVPLVDEDLAVTRSPAPLINANASSLSSFRMSIEGPLSARGLWILRLQKEAEVAFLAVGPSIAWNSSLSILAMSTLIPDFDSSSGRLLNFQPLGENGYALGVYQYGLALFSAWKHNEPRRRPGREPLVTPVSHALNPPPRVVVERLWGGPANETFLRSSSFSTAPAAQQTVVRVCFGDPDFVLIHTAGTGGGDSSFMTPFYVASRKLTGLRADDGSDVLQQDVIPVLQGPEATPVPWDVTDTLVSCTLTQGLLVALVKSDGSDNFRLFKSQVSASGRVQSSVVPLQAARAPVVCVLHHDDYVILVHENAEATRVTVGRDLQPMIVNSQPTKSKVDSELGSVRTCTQPDKDPNLVLLTHAGSGANGTTATVSVSVWDLGPGRASSVGRQPCSSNSTIDDDIQVCFPDPLLTVSQAAFDMHESTSTWLWAGALTCVGLLILSWVALTSFIFREINKPAVI